MPRARLFTCAAIALLSAVAAADQTRTPEAGGGTATPLAAPPAQTVDPDARSTIEGRVVATETGRALPRALVFLSQLGNSSNRLTRECLTDVDGRYRFDNLPAGEYVISSSSLGFVEIHVGQERPGDRIHPIDVPAGEVKRVDFALPRGGVISGRLTDDTGDPIAGIRLVPLLIHYSPNGERIGIPGSRTKLDSYTDDRGDFRVAGLSPGTYLLKAQYEDEPISKACATYYPGTTDQRAAHRFQIGLSGHATANFSLLTIGPEDACHLVKPRSWFR